MNLPTEYALAYLKDFPLSFLGTQLPQGFGTAYIRYEIDAGPKNSLCLSKRNQVTHIHLVSTYSLLEFLTSLCLSNPYLTQLVTLQTFQGYCTFRKMKVNKQITAWCSHSAYLTQRYLIFHSRIENCKQREIIC